MSRRSNLKILQVRQGHQMTIRGGFMRAFWGSGLEQLGLNSGANQNVSTKRSTAGLVGQFAGEQTGHTSAKYPRSLFERLVTCAMRLRSEAPQAKRVRWASCSRTTFLLHKSRGLHHTTGVFLNWITHPAYCGCGKKPVMLALFRMWPPRPAAISA